MLTKFVVTVATVIRTAPDTPSLRAPSIAPGSALAAARAAIAPSGMSHRLVSARPRKTATLARRGEAV